MEFYSVFLSPSLLNDTMEFLSAHEIYCVNLVDNLLQNGIPVVPDFSDCRLFFCKKHDDDIQEIVGVVMLLKSGQMLHCIPFIGSKDDIEIYKQFLRAELSKMLQKRKLFCIMGEDEASVLIQDIYESMNSDLSRKNEPIWDREYELRLYDKKADKTDKKSVVVLEDEFSRQKFSEIRASGKFPAIRCTSRDVTPLMPLQKAYELIEVIPPGMEYSERMSRLNLLKGLSKYQIFGIVAENIIDEAGFMQFIAKGGINACGINTCQIGGVFTEPKFRCQGIAASLVSMIANLFIKDLKNVVLFVDKKNNSAKKAYDNSGFVFVSSYRIIYY